MYVHPQKTFLSVHLREIGVLVSFYLKEAMYRCLNDRQETTSVSVSVH